MNRYKIRIEYNGNYFIGWQKQTYNSNSVQETLEAILSKILKEDIELFAGGRTDSGVHATGQVAHFDTTQEININKFIGSINFFIKNFHIRILECEMVNQNFHARFSAIKRVYCYKINNSKRGSIFWEGRAWHVHNTILNLEKMKDCINLLTGTMDFTAFRSTRCQSKSAIKTIDSIDITRSIDFQDIININIKARSFLHNQVRLIVGALFCIGTMRWSKNDLINVIESRNRSSCYIMAPAYGLFLESIEYNSEN